MNEKKLLEGASSAINRLGRSIWSDSPPTQRLEHQPNEAQDTLRKSGGKIQQLLKGLAWSVGATTLLAILLTWGINSRFGLLLLMLLR